MNRISIAGLVALLALSGCGGGGGTQTAGIGGTGKVSSGSITAFGSIFVNGVEYDISNATITVDEDSTQKSQADLHIGMVVTVDGSSNATSGTATRVTYDSVAEGPVSGLVTAPGGLSKTFSVFGVAARIDQATVFDNSDPTFTFGSIADNDLVKLSGFFDNGTGGTLLVTYIEKTGTFDPANPAGVAEVKGTVRNAPAGGALPANGDTFTVNGVTVTLDAGTALDSRLGGAVNNNTYVEVKGTLNGATSLLASNVELERTAVGDSGDEVELEGLIAGFSSLAAGFQVGGQNVDGSGASLEPPSLQLANGLRVEVEGKVDASGVLVADRIKASGNERIEIEAGIDRIDMAARTLTLGLPAGTITVTTDDLTTYEDRLGLVSPMNLSDLSAGDFVEIKGYQDPTGKVVAVEVRRDTADDIVLQGPLDNFTAGNIRVLGLGFFTGPGTQFTDINGNSVSEATLQGSLSPGDIVQIKDNAPGDGTADEVEQEN